VIFSLADGVYLTAETSIHGSLTDRHWPNCGFVAADSHVNMSNLALAIMCAQNCCHVPKCEIPRVNRWTIE